MPCPFFEPKNIAKNSNPAARLPLIDEYDGLCHANSEPSAAPESARFRFCNHGNAKGGCVSFPADEQRSSLRYEIMGRNGCAINLLCIEEQAYEPLRWYTVEYRCADEHLEPEPPEQCVRSQILAFCRSHQARFRRAQPQSA